MVVTKITKKNIMLQKETKNPTRLSWIFLNIFNNCFLLYVLFLSAFLFQLYIELLAL